MKRSTRRRIAVTLAITGILLTVAVPGYRRHRATVRLNEIEDNLRRVNAADSQLFMELAQSRGLHPDRSMLDGTGGNAAYLVWPKGPVTGEYAPGTCGGRSATLDGGSKGEMTLTEWENTCRADPMSRGL